MRIALISAMGDGSGAGNLALMPLAGRPLVRRQLDVALAMGCERVACLAERPSPEIVQLQHAAERVGAKFNAIPGGRALAGLVKAADELLVLAPGVLLDARVVVDALGNRPGLLVLPAGQAGDAGIERIDREDAWAGIMLVRGDTVERLADIPPDSNPISSLLRLALQRGVRRIVLPTDIVNGGLAFIADSDALARAEDRWLARSVQPVGWLRPGSALVDRLARRFAPRLLASRAATPAVAMTGVVFAVGGVALAGLEQAAAGFAALALSASAFLAARTLRAFARGKPAEAWLNGKRVGDLVLDAATVAAVIAASPRDPWFAAFAAAVLVLAIRLAEQAGDRRHIAPASDRIALLAILALAAGFGKLVPVVQALALVTLLLALIVPSRARLTQA